MAKSTPFVRNAYNYDLNQASDDAGLQCKDKSRTIQSQTEETDINKIVERFAITGELPQNIRLPQYGDFVAINDFHQAANAIAQANEAFDQLPAKVRARFQNDPGQFVDFCTSEGNEEELRKLGLLPPAAPLDLDPEVTTTGHTKSAPARSEPPETALKADTSKSIKDTSKPSKA